MNTEISNQREEEDPLDALLREQALYIDDGGFTARILKTLPGRRRKLLRPIVLTSVSAIGLALAIIWLPWGSLAGLDDVFSGKPQELGPWVLVLSVLFSLVWAIVNSTGEELG